MPSSHLPEICSLLAKILINSSTIALGGRRMSCQPHQGPNLPSESWESSTLTSSCSGVSCQTILLVVLAFGGAEAMDVGSCIFAREAGQGESCKRNTQKKIHQAPLGISLGAQNWGWVEDLSSPVATEKIPAWVKLGSKDTPGTRLSSNCCHSCGLLI